MTNVYDSVTFRRGLGDSGLKITIEDIGCETCGYDRTLKVKRVYPERKPEITHHCRHPNCPNHSPAKSIVPSSLK